MPRRKMWGKIIALSLPIIGSSLSQNIFNLVDSAMIGRLGHEALAACGIAGMMNWVTVAIIIGLSVGVQAITARRYGEKDLKKATGVLNNALVLLILTVPYTLLVLYFADYLFAIVTDNEQIAAIGQPYFIARAVSIPFIAINSAFAGYFNGIHKTGVQLKVVVVMHIVNIALNFVLIFGFLGVPAFGATGAGIGTSAAALCGSAFYFYLALKTVGAKNLLRVKSFSREIITGIFRLSYPICLQQISLSGSLLAFYYIAGLIGTHELAATNIILKISMLCILPCVGLGTAAASLVSSSLGAGECGAARKWGRETIFIGLLYTSAMALAFSVWPGWWLSLFVDDATTVSIGVLSLVIMAVGELVDGMGIIYGRVLTGAGASRIVMWVMLVLQWGWFIPLALIVSVVYSGGIVGLWISWLIYRFTFAVIMLIFFRRSDWETILI